MSEREITIRPAEARDLELMLSWRNNPEIYEYLKEQTGPISWTEHLNWYATRTPERRDWIISYNGRRVGAVAIAADGDIGVWIGEPSARNKGVARTAVQRAIDRVERSVHARVHEDNRASRNLFESLGFSRTATEGEWLTYRRI